MIILSRPRHEALIQEVRKAGARIRLIGDGDVSAAIATTKPETGIDLLLGIGGAPEGVLAAAALRCVGGEFQGRLAPRNNDEIERAKKMGVADINRKFKIDELAAGDVMFAATGVTDGDYLQGVHFFRRRCDDTIRGHALQDQDRSRDQRDALFRAQTDLLVARWVANPRKNVANKRRKKQQSWLKKLLFFVSVPLIVWFAAFLIWFYWNGLSGLVTGVEKQEAKPAISGSRQIKPGKIRKTLRPSLRKKKFSTKTGKSSKIFCSGETRRAGWHPTS